MPVQPRTVLVRNRESGQVYRINEGDFNTVEYEAVDVESIAPVDDGVDKVVEVTTDDETTSDYSTGEVASTKVTELGKVPSEDAPDGEESSDPSVEG